MFRIVSDCFRIVSDRFRTVFDEGAATAQEKKLRAKNLWAEGPQIFCESVCDDRADEKTDKKKKRNLLTEKSTSKNRDCVFGCKKLIIM